MKDQFYIVLSSNNSTKYFPENSPSNFTVRLPYEIQLQGKWSVALVEIQLPETYLHVSRYLNENYIQMTTENIVEEDESLKNAVRIIPTVYTDNSDYYEMNIDESDFTKQNIIAHGIYNSIEEILNQINNLSQLNSHLKFEMIPGGFVQITKICAKNERHKIVMSETIGRILGASDKEDIYIEDTKVYTFKFPASIKNALPSTILVYSDICEPYITGDIQTPLLRRLSLDNHQYMYGSHKIKEFSWLKYIPLQRFEFQMIEINIRDNLGKIIPFENGTLSVTLHFKKIYE